MYAVLILEHSYWLKFWSNQSECLKTSVTLYLYRIIHRLCQEKGINKFASSGEVANLSEFKLS